MSERASVPVERFVPAMLEGLDEPVRRYFGHAIAEGASLYRGVHLQLSGHIRVGAWLRFNSVWVGDGRSFSWNATAGPGPFPFLRVHDQFADGAGFMDIRARQPLKSLPALKLLHVENDDTTRSGAGRAALEALWVPTALLPSRGVTWRAESDELVVATWDVGPGTTRGAHQHRPRRRRGVLADRPLARQQDRLWALRRRRARRAQLRRPHHPEPADRRMGIRHPPMGAVLQMRGDGA